MRIKLNHWFQQTRGNLGPCEEQFLWNDRKESLIVVDFRENKGQKLKILSIENFSSKLCYKREQEMENKYKCKWDQKKVYL